MAHTGIGTDVCLRHGCLPMPIHFYSPIPDIEDLEKRHVWDRKSDLPGIRFDPEGHLSFLLSLAELYGSECKWPDKQTPDPFQFYLQSGCFSFGCAASLHCILRHYKPRRVVEIGSGNSSLVISQALRLNSTNQPPSERTEYIAIDPFPWDILQSTPLPSLTQLIKERVELLDIGFFSRLEKNDVLFVDSSHVVRIGGDVNYLILDILPRLAPGVIVHFHDIDLPYEYPKVYATNPAFRVFWTESYMLQAFLSCNNSFEILCAMGYLMRNHFDEFSRAFPFFDPSADLANSSSFWIRRKD